MANATLLRARGLYTHPNALSEMPEGALIQADNVVIDRNGIVEPRRGFKQYSGVFGSGTDISKQLLTYKNRILNHYSNILQYDNGSGTLSNFSGSYSETENGLRIKAVESNGNLYFTSSTGVQCISAKTAGDFTGSVGFIKKSGATEALDVTGVVNYATSGFFGDQLATGINLSKVAYRITWAFKDVNGNFVEGAPSSRLVMTNYSTANSGTVVLTFAVPSAISATDTAYYYRIYRTGVVQASTLIGLDSIDPGDEMNLVLEDFPSAAQLISRTVEIEDVTPESFRSGGALLYSNGISGEGILQSNYPPPLAKDIALFRNTLFFANTATKQQLNLALLSVENLISNTSSITINQAAVSNTYTFRGQLEVITVPMPTKAALVDGSYLLLHSASNLRKYCLWFDKVGDSSGVPTTGVDGYVLLRVDVSAAGIVTASHVSAAAVTVLNATVDFLSANSTGTLQVSTTNNGNCNDADSSQSTPGIDDFTITYVLQGLGEDKPTLKVLLALVTDGTGTGVTPSQAIDQTARSLVNIINSNPSEVVEAFYMSNFEDLPGLILLKAKNLSDPAFSIIANSISTGASFDPALPTSGITVKSENETEPNSLYYSKFQQPEAVPIINKFSVGPKDKAILRILPLRDSLFVLKEDGIYRVTGEAGVYNLDPFDSSAIILAADSAVVLNNQIYMLSSQGIVTVSDTGVSVISRPIENIIDRVTSAAFSYKTNTFGVNYESDRAYLLWTVSNTSDTTPTQCFRFNTFTNSWTRFPIAKTCGIVNSADDKLYMGATDQNFIEQERKEFLRTDYADREYAVTITEMPFVNKIAILSSVQQVTALDVMVQEQYLTLAQFNQTLKKLDLDNNTTYKNYFSTLGLVAAGNLRTGVNDLAAKLDTDTGVANATFVAGLNGLSSFVVIQQDFNSIITKLNTASGIDKKNFYDSEGTVTFETLIESRIVNGNKIVMHDDINFVTGAATIVKGIHADFTWAPQHFGEPSALKQVSEGTLILEDVMFHRASLGYASDLSGNYEFVSFNEGGPGDWGGFLWGENDWGGFGSQIPFRTYIPRNKQKCRFIKPRFKHSIAREKFAVYGLSLVYRLISSRAYRT